MPCRVPKRRFSCGAPQHLTKNPIMLLFFSRLVSHDIKDEISDILF